MNYCRLLSALTLICFLSAAQAGEQMLSLTIGPLWPQALAQTKSKDDSKTVWNGSVEVGTLFDKRVGLGFDGDFMWKINDDDTTYMRITSFDTIPVTSSNKKERYFMFPASLFLLINPLPDLVVRPVFKGQVGFNTLYYGKSNFTGGTERKSKDSGFYFGLITKVSVDAECSLSQNVGVFAGFEYAWSEPRRSIGENETTSKSMNGPGIRLGMRFAI